KTIAESGFTGPAISERIKEEIGEIDYEVREDSRLSAKKTFRGADEKSLPGVVILGTGLSLQDAVQGLRQLFGQEPTVVKLSIESAQTGTTARIEVGEPNGDRIKLPVVGPFSDLDVLISASAERILSQLDAAKLALYLHAIPERRKEYQAILRDCVDKLEVEQ